MKCPYCGMENDEQNKNCIHCKAGLPQKEEHKEEPVTKRNKKERENNGT